MTDKEMGEKSLQLIRHQLGSVDLSDVREDPELKEEEQKNYDAAISAVMHHLERDIKRLQYQQLEFMGLNAEHYGQVIFGRGTFNGADLLLHLWKEAHTRHLARSEGNEQPDQSTPIGEI